MKDNPSLKIDLRINKMEIDINRRHCKILLNVCIIYFLACILLYFYGFHRFNFSLGVTIACFLYVFFDLIISFQERRFLLDYRKYLKIFLSQGEAQMFPHNMSIINGKKS